MAKESNSIDTSKLNNLMTVWLEHEHWVQTGCPKDQRPSTLFPGYGFLAEQDVRGYDVYRHALVPYFSEASGFSGVHDSLLLLIKDAEKKAPTLFSQMLALYDEPGERFRAQWGNLFGSIFHDGLTHQSLLSYQRKFEVELPLFLLAHLREIVSTGSIDKNLDRFRDRSGNLKKGVVAQYIIDGLSNYPNLCAVIMEGYRPKLRNAIGHNSYVIENGCFRALDQNISLTKEEFFRCFDALQIVQNATVWYLMSRRSCNSKLNTKGVIAIGWATCTDSKVEYPQLFVYQLAPFYRSQPGCEWLRSVKVKVAGGSLSTELSGSNCIPGEYDEAMKKLLELANVEEGLKCEVVPVMPCLHQHEGLYLNDGEYCKALEGQELSLPVSIAV